MNRKVQSGRYETVSAVPAPIPFPDEVAHLAMMNEKLDAAVQAANDNVKKIDKEYADVKRYMADYRGEIDPHEMFQNELALKQIDRTGAFAVGIWEKVAKLKESPYFARIDFQTKDDSEAIKHYIGRFAFTHENQLLILDWRAPIASMFYDYEIGPAGYEAPIGRIEGNLTRKRQFKIKNGMLEYAIETSVNIQDDVLQRELSHTSDEKMKSIISTIQKEQNQIIRNDKAKTMLIQGVAGSGKTSIALHRIAFLLYRFRNTLSANNVTILSPNKVFGDYIANVLPELGEEPICERSFWDIADTQLNGVIQFEPEKDPLETEDAKWAERVRFKSTIDFVRKMDSYIEELPRLIFESTDYTFGQFSVTADWIKNRFFAYQSYPIKKRLELIANDIHDHFESVHFMGDEIPRAKAVLKSLTAMLKMKNTLALYKDFYQWLGHPHLLVLSKKQTLEWSDVFPFLYLHRAFLGLKENKFIKHLVIDEMQDYTPIQYAVINRIYSCQKTILGDFGQSINPNHLHTLAQLQELYSNASLVELNKSYRSTYEIIAFAKGIGQAEKLEPVVRHGDVPMVISCANKQEELHKIRAKLNDFLQSDGVSLGIILKTNSAAKEMYNILKQDYDIQHISMDSTHFENGISVTSVQMSKGLEFDEVIVPDVSEDDYYSNYDRSLLYIACTRAMHKLTLLYTGKPTHFLSAHIQKNIDK
ncbi:MAG: ATP-binding domain-containing protein [Anaerotignum sp.]|nr:ATP-binding domain-containing protein [Anaerotignum sp.]